MSVDLTGDVMDLKVKLRARLSAGSFLKLK